MRNLIFSIFVYIRSSQKGLFGPKLLIIISFLVIANPGFSTHLIGGNIGYEYLGTDPLNPNNTRYRISLDAYMDCNSPYWVSQPGGTFPPAGIGIGIYEGILSPTSALNLTTTLTLPLKDSNEVDPNLPQICNPFNLLAGVCVYLVRYEAIVSLRTSSVGYWVIYDRCCRPGVIDNLNNPGDQSFSYLTWIPAQNGSLITNSTAQFTDTLLSYICETDTSYISNLAIDPDGDSLVYSLVTPLQGRTDKNAPLPNYNFPPLNPYTIPPPLVNYSTGHSLANLLGAGSFSSVNPDNGLTRFLSDFRGVYVAAIEITEYRNDTIVGVSRRNMQLICDNCPNNNMPNQNTTNLDSTALSPLVYEVEAGLSICFDLDYDDTDNDPLEFVATGDIFNSVITNPAATVTSPVTGIGSVTGTICWSTTCAQGQTAPYIVDVVVTDSNCPPLPLPQVLYIKVIPFLGPERIYGDTVICVDNNPSTFSTDTLPNVTYNWTVTGGAITNGNGTSGINITWTPGQTVGTISVTSTNQNGCIAGPLSRSVILSNVVSDAGNDTTTCTGIPVQIGGSPTSQDPNNTISWFPGTGLSDSIIANPMANPAVTTTYIVSLTNALGCVGMDTIVVVVNNPIPSGILSDYFVCPGDTLQVNAVGNIFNWGPNQFISNVNIANPKIYPPSDMQYVLNYFDMNGCEGNDTTDILVNASVPTNAGPDAQVCMGDSLILGGSPTGPFGTTYLWSPSGNMNDNTLANPSIFIATSTTFVVITSNDTCTGIDSIDVIILPSPPLSLSADSYVCTGDSTQLTATGIGSFEWNNGITLSDSTIFNPIAFPSVPTYYTVTLTDGSLCSTFDSVFIDVTSLPLASAGGLIEACKWIPIVIGGNPTGPQKSSYNWIPTTGLSNAQASNPLVTLNSDQTYVLQVTDSLGCVSFDTLEVEVFRLFGELDTTLCINQQLDLSTHTFHGNGPFTYQWSNASSLSDSTSGSPFINTGSNSNFTVTVTDANNCTDTVDFNIGLLAISTAEFSYDILPTCEGVGVQVNDNSNGSTSYQWLINGELVSSEQNPLLHFEYNTEAEVTLITSSSDGCEDTAQIIVQGPTFTDLVDLTISNVFTPNGDGENDYFEVISNGDISNCINLTIFNRGGQIVHQSSGGIHTWDGRNSTGLLIPHGVYFYIYDINGVEYHGTVSLLR